ncbi:MAG: LacI family transcriptional regulator [Telmatospirillum sp.]|nr:LacI family transcriptional regulator [Telmatospirillum sp.]
MATITEIARRAGVSTSTVSHVINRTRFVSDEMKARVAAAIDDLGGYQPNAVAQSLRSNTTHTIGMILPNNTNPFFAEIVRGVEDECFRRGYSLILCNSDDDPTRQARHLRVLISKRVDGLVILSSGIDGTFVRLLADSPIPLVMVDRETEAVAADLVQVDHEQGGYLAGRHLADLGHRRIALISGPPDLPVNDRRQAGFRRALAEAGIGPDPRMVIHTEFTSRGGYESLLRLLEGGSVPTAVFADNDLMAIGVICAAREAGLSVPGDLSVVGFDDIALAAYTNPPLTTICQPKHLIGTETARLLAERIQEPDMPPKRRIMPPELCVRATTRAISGQGIGHPVAK